jgi:Na+/H+-dicarboxylate symporter
MARALLLTHLFPVYAVVVAIDWFIDRFRTMLNVSSDLFAVGIITKLSGVRDPEGVTYETTAQEALANVQGQPGVRQDSKV